MKAVNKIIGVCQITIVDMNDFQSGNLPPEGPKRGDVWLDMSVNPPVFKIWTGTEWILENDWHEQVGDLNDSLNETKHVLVGTNAAIEALKNEVNLKAETEYVDRIKKELTLGGKNVMPYTYMHRENIESFWISSHPSISTFNVSEYNFGVEGNDDYFIKNEKILKFSLNGVKATAINVNYTTGSVIDEKRYVKLKITTKYTFSSWIYKNSFCEKFKFVIFNKTKNKIHATSSLFSAESDKFKKYSLTFTTDETEEYCVIFYNYVKPGASGDSNIFLYNMIIEKGDATDVWSPCIDDVGSSSIAYMEEALKQLKGNLKVSDDMIIANVSEVEERVESVDGKVKTNTKWIENAQFSIDSGNIIGTVSNYLPGSENLMPYTHIDLVNLEKDWNSTPKGSISKRIYDFGEVSSEDNFLYGKNVLMVSCTPLDASSVTDSIITVSLKENIRDIILETNTKYTISYYLYITDRIKSVKCQIWNKIKNKSLDTTLEEKTTITKYNAHFVKVQCSFTTTTEDTIYYPKFIMEMKKDLLRDANIYLAKMMIQKGSVNITWTPNTSDTERYVADVMNEEMVKVNDKFLEYGRSLTNLSNYLDGAFKDGVIDFSEAENIKESLRYLNIEKQSIDSRYVEIINNPSLGSKNLNELKENNKFVNDETSPLAILTISEIKVLEAFRNGRFKIRYKVGNETSGEIINHFISKNGEPYEEVKSVKFGEHYEAIGTELPPGDNRVTIKVINSSGQVVSPNITVTIRSDSKTHLTFSKTQYDNKYNSLVSIIDNIISSGIVTENDKVNVNNAFKIYGDSLAEFHAAFNSALDEIAESKVSQLSQQLDNKMAQFKITTDEISSKVERNESITSGVLDDVSNLGEDIKKAVENIKETDIIAKDAASKAQEAQITANAASESSSFANNLLRDISSDNKLTANEKQNTKLEFVIITSEKDKIISDATQYKVSTTDYINNFNSLNSYITPLLLNLNETSDVNGETFRNKFSNYYTSKQIVLNNISTEAKKLSDAAQGDATTAIKNASEAHKAATIANDAAISAQKSADSSNKLLEDIASDSKLTASEKQSTKLEWEVILSEKDKIIADANLYEQSTTDYISKFNTLNSYITPLLSSLTETSDIVGTTFRANFSNYYSSKQTLLNNISNKSKQLYEKAQKDVNTAIDNAKAAQDTADTAKSSAETANNSLADIASDSKLTASEKQSTKLEWDKIVSEKNKIVEDATNYSVSCVTYNSMYNALNAYITPLLSNLNSTSDMVGTTFRTNFSNYYNSRQDVLNEISKKTKELADAAQDAADIGIGEATKAIANASSAASAALAAQNTADTAKTAATNANNSLAEIASDNKLTAGEKQNTKLEWEIILGEKDKIIADANLYEQSTTDYISKFNTLNSYITPLLSSLTETSDIVGTTFRANFSNYYSSRQTLLNNISSKSKEIADTAQKSANTAINNAKAAQDTADTARSSAGKANDLLTDIASDSKLTAVEKQSTKLEWDKIVSERSKIIADANNYSVSTTDYTNKYNALNSYITPLLSNLTETSDIVGTTFRTNFSNYYSSRQDVLNLISAKSKALVADAQSAAETAQKSAKTASDKAQAAQDTADTAKTSAQEANGLLFDIASDDRLTASEKQNAKLEWDIIVGEKPKITTEASTYGVSSTAYTNMYNALSTYISPLLTSLTETSIITGTTFRTNFSNYYNARQDLLNSISTKAKKLADDAQTLADTLSKTVESIGKRLSTAESKIEADAITNTVTSSVKYKNDLNSKPNKDTVYTKGEIEDKDYQSSSQVQQKVDDLKIKFSKSGGYNKIKNSDGSGRNKNWITSDPFLLEKDMYLNELTPTGAKSSMKFSNSTINAEYASSTRFAVVPGRSYSISGYYMVCTGCKGIRVWFLGSNAVDFTNNTTSYTWSNQILNDAAVSNGTYKYFYTSFTVPSDVKSAYVRIDHMGSSTADIVSSVKFTKLLVAEGDLDFEWSPHPDETYDGIIEMNQDGINITRSDTDGFTNIDNRSLSVIEKGATIASFGESSNIPELISGTIYAEEIKSANIVNTQEGVDLYVDMTNGLDENLGTEDSQLKTIQGALDKLNKYCIDNIININIKGTGSQEIRVEGFNGSGIIRFNLDTATKLFCNTFDFINCTVNCEVNGNKPNVSSKVSAQIIQDDGGTLIYVRGCTMVYVKDICLVGQKSGTAITGIYGTHILVKRCEIDRFQYTVFADSSTIISMADCIGSDVECVASGVDGGCIYIESWANNSIVPQYTDRTYSSSNSARYWRPGLAEGSGVKKPGLIYPPTYVPPPIPPAVQYTKTWVTTKIYSDETLNGWSDKAELIQGYYSGWSTGRWTGYIKFNDSNIRTTISGGTNLSGRLYIRRRSSSHGVFSGAVIALYGSDGTAIDTTSKFDLGTSRWISLSSTIISKIQSGAIKYFYVKYDSSNQSRYIKFESDVRLEITYKK